MALHREFRELRDVAEFFRNHGVVFWCSHGKLWRWHHERARCTLGNVSITHLLMGHEDVIDNAHSNPIEKNDDVLEMHKNNRIASVE